MRPLVLHYALLAALLTLASSPLPGSTADAPQRELYREAMELVARGHTDRAQDILYRLKGYPLQSYLEAEILLAHIDSVSPRTIELFVQENRGSIIGNRVERRWLQHLAHNGDWKTFLDQYRPQLANTRLRCQRVAALRHTGRHQAAIRETGKLWLSGHSLPRACDDALERWLDRHPNPEQALWDRAELAMEAKNASLVRYLLGRIPVADSVQQLLYRPAMLPKHVDDLPTDARHRKLAVHPLKRLAALDYERADEAWPQLHEHLDFADSEQFAIRQAIARPMIAANDPQALEWLQRTNADGSDEYLLEWEIRLLLRSRDWKQVAETIQRLGPELREEPQWRYWLSRAELARHDPPPEAALQRMADLAEERHYYGFLAADRLQRDYRLNFHRRLYPELIGVLRQRPEVERARELQALGELYRARLEWREALRGLNDEELTAMAELARRWGWDHQAIMTALYAGSRDDLELRFPMAFAETFRRTADSERLDLHWLYAIARQESAFSERAASPAGALGIMQVMPDTARQVIRQKGGTYRRGKLLEAQYSIPLGASYLSDLLDAFNGNRILATAAYNVGPAAVQRVLARQREDYPFDIWIETLPYSETRHYVKGVLAFAIVYSKRMGEQLPLVSESEQRISSTFAVALSEPGDAIDIEPNNKP